MSLITHPPSAPTTPLLHRVASSRLARALTHPHGLAAYLAPFEPTLAATGDQTRVVAVQRETADMATVTIRTPRTWTPPLAGQHVLLGVELDGRRNTRAFTISSSARRADGCFTISAKINPDGVVSRHLVESLAPGTVVTVSTPRGEFLTPTGGRLILLLSGGSGITPVMSMLRTMLDDVRTGSMPSAPVTFLHYTSSRDDLPFLDELAQANADHDWLDVVVITTQGEGTLGTHGLTGRLTAAHLDNVLDGATDIRACGPAGLIELLRDLTDGDDRVASLDVEYFRPPAPAGEASGGTITFTRSGVSVEDDGRPLLDQAEAAGLSPQFGCRMGICHTCVCPMTAGRVRDSLTGHIETEDTTDVRLCINTAEGDVEIDL